MSGLKYTVVIEQSNQVLPNTECDIQIQYTSMEQYIYIIILSTNIHSMFMLREKGGCGHHDSHSDWLLLVHTLQIRPDCPHLKEHSLNITFKNTSTFRTSFNASFFPTRDQNTQKRKRTYFCPTFKHKISLFQLAQFYLLPGCYSVLHG